MRALLPLVLMALASPAVAADLTYQTGSTPAVEAAMQLMNIERGLDADPQLTAEFMQVAEIDIDHDGVPELFAFAESDYFCGTAGCVPRLYQRQGDAWRELDIGLNDFTNSQPTDWSIDENGPNGHVTFILNESSFVSHYIWDGTAYVPAD